MQLSDFLTPRTVRLQTRLIDSIGSQAVVNTVRITDPGNSGHNHRLDGHECLSLALMVTIIIVDRTV